MRYIIEHLDKKLYKWSEIEYKHASSIVGKKNIIFTNLNKTQSEKLKSFGEVTKQRAEKVCLGRVCVLDPLAEKILTPQEAKEFDYLVFGGLLGDFEIDAKTKKLITFKAERRNLGKKEMPTDTAVLCVKMIADRIPFDKIKFQDGLDVDITDEESISLDYRYIILNGKPSISDDLVKYLKKRKHF
ncbi:MAG: SAM-dependent methyltransferase [Candidatus Woesearchaeota archaeon]|nr:SAM-dependent methyltransferase [Candidatus Woesearchaeota archaeon]